MIGFCVLIMWEMRKSFGSIIKSMKQQESDNEDDWLWNLSLELDIENVSQNEVIWEPTTVELFCDRSSSSVSNSTSSRRSRRRKNQRSALDWFKIALGLDDENLQRRRRLRRNRSELMATLSFWCDDDKSEDDSLCVKSGTHRYKVGATFRVRSVRALQSYHSLVSLEYYYE